MKYLDLVRYEKDNLELYIKEVTGEVFATIRALARMCDKELKTIGNWEKNSNISTIKAEVYTACGFRIVSLFDENAIQKAFKKYNPALAERCEDCGTRLFLYGKVGIRYEQLEKEKKKNDWQMSVALFDTILELR